MLLKRERLDAVKSLGVEQVFNSRRRSCRRHARLDIYTWPESISNYLLDTWRGSAIKRVVKIWRPQSLRDGPLARRTNNVPFAQVFSVKADDGFEL